MMDETARRWEFEIRVPIMLERRFKDYQGTEFTCSNFFVVPANTPIDQDRPPSRWIALALGYNKSGNSGKWRSCEHDHVEDTIIEALEVSTPSQRVGEAIE